MRAHLILSAALLGSITVSGASAQKTREKPVAAPVEPSWPGAEMPLPLTVKTPEDLTFKEMAERQYLLFNLLASGKLAFDRGDPATAAAKWETLLRVPDLPNDLEQVVRPLALEARRRATEAGVEVPPPGHPSPSGSSAVATSSHAAAPRTPPLATVRGTVTGGGSLGPGGTVVWLKRKDGPTPRPKPAQGKTITQKGKRFIPRVLAVPLGTTVHFRNDDDLFHNVFSLSKPNDFDLGLYRSGVSRDQAFHTSGPVNLLCNIHASMAGYVYVVDTPYYAQADRRGVFAIQGVPPGEYILGAWHETSASPVSQPVSVRSDGAIVAVTVISDKVIPPFVPDKAGKPRQPQLGY